ncbi:MAG: energy transducer TonB [Candidatus Acidiferrales bacterium]
MPKDPAALLDIAAKVNGLSNPVSAPWHLRVSYQIFDDKGRPQASGTYEELWLSEDKYKRSYSSPNFTQTDFATDRGLFRSGNQNWPGPQETLVRTELLEPVPAGLNLSGLRLENNRRSIDKIDLRCVALKADWTFFANDAYCFQADKPILRYTDSGNSSGTVYNDMFIFQGHFLARDVRETINGKPRMLLHIDVLEQTSTINDSDLTPPPDAVLIPNGKIAIPSDTMRVLLVKQIPPHYPSGARGAGITGKVILQITIGKDGRVTNAQAISGPTGLRQAAIDAVLKWEYRPFFICGKPAEVETTLPIVFSVG